MKCPHCNTENPDGMKFCSNCGRTLVRNQFGKNLVNGSNPIFIKALKALYILSGAVTILLLFSLSKFDTNIEKKWEACKGHCIEIAVEVTSSITWVTDFEMEAFNYKPPCSYSRKSSLLTPHKPMTDANLEKFVKTAVKKYKEKVWANIGLFGLITLMLYGLFYYFTKKKSNNIESLG